MFDPLQDIHHYSQTLTISQVVKFFEKKEMNITRAMVQNYIRDGLLPPAVNKRYYTHKHLAALVLIDYFKTVFDMAVIKATLGPLMDGEGLPLDKYSRLMQKWEKYSNYWKETVSGQLFEKGPHDELSILLLMVHTADLKALADTLATN